MLSLMPNYSPSTTLRPPRDVTCPPRRARRALRDYTAFQPPEPRLQPYRMGAVQKRQKREPPLARAAILLHPPFVATLRVPVALSHAFQPQHHLCPPPLLSRRSPQ
jgi:hypothetical protein